MNPPPSHRLRILQCITRLGLGGAEQVALSIIRGLSADFDFGVFTVHHADDNEPGRAMRTELGRLGIPWHGGTTIPMKAGGMIPGAVHLAVAMRRFRPDVLHFHSETPEACGAMLAALYPPLRRRPIVRTIHNSVFWRYWPGIGRWCDRRLASAHIASVSEGAQAEFERYRQDSGASPPPEKPRIIYNGIAGIFQPPHGAPHVEGRRRVLCAGRFEYQKGMDVLAHALPQVVLDPGVTGELVLVGQGAQEPHLRRLAVSPPAGWKVVIQSPAPGLDGLFSAFDLVVMPSRFEGLGLVSVEATLAGLPVVVTDAPGLRETVLPNHPWIAQPDDVHTLATALTQALRETHRWKSVVQTTQNLARERFSLAEMSAKYRQLYLRASRDS